MQDDNLQHMEYLLTKEAYENWVLKLSVAVMRKYLTNASIKSLKEFYFKEHGLPLGSVIKE